MLPFVFLDNFIMVERTKITSSARFMMGGYSIWLR